MQRCLIAFFSVLLGATEVSAQVAAMPDAAKTAWFYNRPNSVAVERDGALSACYEFSRAMLPESNEAPYAAQFGLVGALLTDSGQARRQAKLPRLIQEYADDCMIANGYRRFHVDGVSHDNFLAEVMSTTERDHLAGAETPSRGVLSRTFANESWLPSDADAPLSDNTYSTLRVAIGSTFFGVPRNRGVEPGQAIAPGPGQAVLISSITGDRGDVYLYLSRVDSDGRPALELGPTAQIQFIGKGNKTIERAFVVPAGRYVLESVNYTRITGYGSRSFCLRTASFELGPGEVRHTGDFILDAPGKRVKEEFAGVRFGTTWSPRLRINAPDMSSAARVLANEPELAAKLQPVEWRNGASFPCPATPALFVDIGGIDVPSR